MQFKSPTGSKIVGTLETLKGVASVSGFNDDGSPIYAGGTTIDWDSQQTVMGQGGIIYVDDDGQEWVRADLTAVHDEEERV